MIFFEILALLVPKIIFQRELTNEAENNATQKAVYLFYGLQRKLADLLLTIQMTRSYATTYDYDIDLNGEFSPMGFGGTPFGPFPMQWPTPVGASMIEIMISDYTINSLLYWMHRYDLHYFGIAMASIWWTSLFDL